MRTGERQWVGALSQSIFLRFSTSLRFSHSLALMWPFPTQQCCSILQGRSCHPHGQRDHSSRAKPPQIFKNWVKKKRTLRSSLQANPESPRAGKGAASPFPCEPIKPWQAPSQQHGFQNKKLLSSAINAGAVVTLLKVGSFIYFFFFFPPPPCMTKDGKSCG